MYFICLLYLFLGIAIIADMFMEAIEVITSQTKTVEIWDDELKKNFLIDVPIWNATVANLTLMALGSSAPEILLSVIGTVQDIEAIPSKLGPGTIVGSAAFNLLIISALSIIAVDETPKKISDVGVFFITSICSMWAYIWLYLSLQIWSSEVIEMWEAWLTLAFFFILIILSYSADRLNRYLTDKRKTKEEENEQVRLTEVGIKKNRLRAIAKEQGDAVVIEVAEGINVMTVSDQKQREIRELYRQILGQDDLGKVETTELYNCLKPDSLLERFAYRKQAGMGGAKKDFIKIKRMKGQLENNDKIHVEVENDIVGFKCLHYSVTESSGNVEITIVKKVN